MYVHVVDLWGTNYAWLNNLTMASATLAWHFVKTNSEPFLAGVVMLVVYGAKNTWLRKRIMAGATRLWCHFKISSWNILAFMLARDAKYSWFNELKTAIINLVWHPFKAASKEFLAFVLVLSLRVAKYAWLTILLLRAGDVETNPGPNWTRDAAGTSKVNKIH